MKTSDEFKEVKEVVEKGKRLAAAGRKPSPPRGLGDNSRRAN